MPKKKTPDEEAIKAQHIASIISKMTYDGDSLRKACRAEGIAPSTFIGWVDADPVVAEQYARAREALLEHWAEDIIDISDEAIPSTQNGGLDSAAVAKQRLQVDSRKWLLSKLAPKRYGDRVAVAGDSESPLHVVGHMDAEQVASIAKGFLSVQK